ncbi:potassium uptake protein [Leuconostoc litchii]|uniref:Trk family potassium uptake protein n=1 Tax=Leuconostoc litchii TaxID=1981069 RepID=A0A6P2CK45_9LACO|nr:potassium transporter TrkG [Leuconostoc litchii]TYC46238.1 Trk family potassium uptake protein [Leuconostoc litchii]GMA69942.1 potassium uptake protein [Leuconostoc litchii]
MSRKIDLPTAAEMQKFHHQSQRHNFWSKISMPQRLSLGFLTVITVGAFLLMLPFSYHGNIGHTFMDGLFTATSAASVTGLTVVDTAQHWTIFGQIVIMILVEIGALGFMSFSVLLFTATRRQMDLKSKMMVQEVYNLESLYDTRVVFGYVIKLSLIIQTIGALLLAPFFMHDFGWKRGMFYAIFHAISAFGNSGFSILPKGTASYNNQPWVLLIIAALIVAGSLGFLVWRDLLLYRATHHLTLHSKLALVMTSALIIGGWLLFELTEHNIHSAQSISPINRLFDTLFMSISYRTAGFAQFSFDTMSSATVLLTMMLMYIGGTPGSTAGGIKTTTLGVLILQTRAALRGKKDVVFSHRRLSHENIVRALLLVFVSLVFLGILSFLLMLTQEHAQNYGLEYVIFEVVSAFATTGLTLGLTPHLTTFGQIIIMLAMFIGRVGIYTVMFSILNVHDDKAPFRYPEESVIIG